MNFFAFISEKIMPETPKLNLYEITHDKYGYLIDASGRQLNRNRYYDCYSPSDEDLDGCACSIKFMHEIKRDVFMCCFVESDDIIVPLGGQYVMIEGTYNRGKLAYFINETEVEHLGDARTIIFGVPKSGGIIRSKTTSDVTLMTTHFY